MISNLIWSYVFIIGSGINLYLATLDKGMQSVVLWILGVLLLVNAIDERAECRRKMREI